MSDNTQIPIPHNEDVRVRALYEYDILDTGEEGDFNAIVELASHICQAPISLISLIDSDRQWFKARVGFELPETKREDAFCAYAIHQDDTMIVHDATQDQRFHSNPYVVGDDHIRFYAGTPLITPDGYKLGTLCVIDKEPRVLTEPQKKALEILARQVMKMFELRKKNGELTKLVDMNKQMFSIISHDVRSPMHSLLGLLELSEKYDLPVEEFKSSLPKIRKTINATTDLLSNVLQWASSQLPGKRIQLEPLNLQDMAARIAEANSQAFENKGNKVINKINPAHVGKGERNMTEFVFRNLMLNANKFTQKGTITLASKKIAHLVEVEVRDSGTGMENPNQEEIFSWSVRTSSDGTHGEKGSGLGLPMCRELVELQGGTIRFESEEGKGTSFFFTLPL